MIKVDNKNQYVYQLPELKELCIKYPNINWNGGFFEEFKEFYYSKSSVNSRLIKKFYGGYWQRNKHRMPVIQLYKEFLINECLSEMKLSK